MDILSKIKKLIDEYQSTYFQVWESGNFKHPLSEFVRKDIADSFRKIEFIQPEHYCIKSSCGTGKWTAVPWIAIFDKRITEKATEGIYIVYLLNKDTKELYLTLNQAATGSNISALKANAQAIQKELRIEKFEPIKTGSDVYDAGCIAAKKYTINDLNDEESFLNDLNHFMLLYNKYVEWYLYNNNDDIRSAFLKYLGPEDSLNGYEKSYKLVLYKVMFDLMDHAGVCSSKDVTKAFRKFYVDRVTAGKIADINVDKRIEFINDSSVKDIYNIIIANPFKVISEKGFIFKTNEHFEQEKMCFNADLIDQISNDDFYEIGQIIEKKLELYFSRIDGASSKGTWSLEDKFKKWIEWQPQRKPPYSRYAQSSIDAMVSILKRGASAFKSKKEIKNFFDISDKNFFTLFAKEMYPLATELDKKYGHSDYRNALDFYSRFLEDMAIDDIDYNLIKKVADSYEKNFDEVYNAEKYKIEALLHFNKYWDIDAKDFAEMIKNAFSKASNLLTNANYYAYKSLIVFSQEEPEILRALFRVLYDEEQPLIERFNFFKSESDNFFNVKNLSSYQDLHAITVYLFFKYPHKYCIYKAGFYKKFAEYIGYSPDKTKEDYNTIQIKNNDTIFSAVKYVLSTHSEPLLNLFKNKSKEWSGYDIPLNYWAFDVIHSIAYKNMGLNTSHVDKEGDEMTTKQKFEAIKNYIAAKGFNYEGNLIENFYLSLKSKPFVILAGTSGTGKTRLVKLFAEAIGAKMKLVPVRPDWSDSSDLFGHTDLSNKFQPGAIIDFIKQAEWDKETPYFLCLDEMNLARVEYYLSDFLSVIETRDRKDNGDIETDAMVDVDYYKDKEAQGKYGRVFIPENLYIVGTVNMDETTFPFSKKVLDRANTIEFSYVDLMTKPDETSDSISPLDENNSFLKTEYLYLRDCDNSDVVDSVCFDLNELNTILVKANLHVGYRVRDEICFYMMNNKKADLLERNVAFDNEIMQKILPRIQGSSRAIKDVLSEMFIKCAGDYSGLAGATDFEQMQSYIDSAKDCKYPNSAKKIAFMMRRYEEDGFTSYWL